jgi:enoyl-CoA hydratase
LSHAEPALRVEISDHIATVTLDRPPANALTTDVYREIGDVFRAVGDRDSGARVVIFTGAGKYFCVGKDLKTPDDEPEERRNAALRAAFGAIVHCEVPVIAAVNGAALGAGFTAVLGCDIIVASSAATFGLPEINAGLAGGLAITRRGFNQYQARRLSFTGGSIGAAELYRLGVAERVVEPDDLMPEARQLAATLASKSPLALRAAKWSANEVEKLVDFEQAYRAIESRVTIALAQSQDHHEAIAAFQERRVPDFKGR